MQKPRELTALLDLLRDRPLVHVLEIGGMRGGTAWAWSKITTGQVVVVDLFVLEGRMERGPQNCLLVEGDSHQEATRERVAFWSYDFLFIDGDHSYDGVRRDFELYAPLVAPGGVIALHDVSVEQPARVRAQHDVVPYWNQIRALYEHEEIYDSTGEPWGGIGVLRVPDDAERAQAALHATHTLTEPAPEHRRATVPSDGPCRDCGRQLAAGEDLLCAGCAAA